jgi:uncharacterized protein YkwD
MDALAFVAAMLCQQFTLEGHLHQLASQQPIHQRPVLVSMMEEHNRLRRSVGLSTHQMSAELTAAAQDHAEYMARTRQFSHYSNGGPQGRAVRHGFPGAVRENIAVGQKSVVTAFRTWHYSGGHWANICSQTSYAGFGYAVSSSGTPYWVAMYANRNDRPSKSDAAH